MFEMFSEELRLRGYRMTPQREMIIKTLSEGQGHMSAEEIYAALQVHTRALNLATVYRTLDLLVEEGFACRNDLGSGKVLYTTHNHGAHMHLICRVCSKEIEANYPLISPLGDLLQEQYGFQADLEHLSIFGVCSDCQGND